MGQIVIYLLLFAAVIGGLEMWKKNAIDKDRVVQEAKLLVKDKATLVQDKKDLQAVVDFADELSKKRVAEQKAAEARATEAERKLNELAKRKPAVQTWLDGCIDLEQRQLRRDRFPNSPQTPVVPCAGKGTEANPGATAERPKEPRPSGGSSPVAGRADPVQQREAGRPEATAAAKPVETVPVVVDNDYILKRLRAQRSRP